MRRNDAFVRKVAYLVAVAVLLFPLYLIGAPARLEGEKMVGGGRLAALRSEYKLSESDLGEIDPTSESIKLATLGLDCVAAAILWNNANEYKKKEDWDNLKATLNQLILLQKHYIGVWQFQAWNLSYNVSVEFDDFRYRYHWVKKGIDFLIEGSRYNHNEPRLLWDIGWFFGQKLGKADEHVQFRRLFRNDEDFHKTLPLSVDNARDYDGRVDNWLVGRMWFLDSQRVVDTHGVPLRGRSPLLFHSSPAMALIDYATAVEDEGYFGEKIRYAWMKAGESWHEYGARLIPTSSGIDVRLNDLEMLDQEAVQLQEQLDDLTRIERESLRAKRIAELYPEERQVLDIPPQGRSEDQQRLAAAVEDKIRVHYPEFADQIPHERRRKTEDLAERLANNRVLADTIERNRSIVNFEYWRTRCASEQTPHAVNARKYVYEADRLFDDAVLVGYTDKNGVSHPGAKEMYEMAWQEWAKVFDAYPVLMKDITAEDLIDKIHSYERLLGQLDEPFPNPFVLQKLIDVQAGVQAAEAEPLPIQDEKKEASPETSTPPAAQTPPPTSQERPSITPAEPIPDDQPPAGEPRPTSPPPVAKESSESKPDAAP